MKTSFRRLGAALLLFAVAGPLSASHGEIRVTRSPSGPVLAGSQIVVTVHVENTSTTEDLVDATINTAVTDPDLVLIPGSVTTRYEESTDPSGQIVLGNDPGDDDVHVFLDPVPAGWTAQIAFRMRLAAIVAAGEEEAFTQVFLTYCDPFCRSIPAFVVVPIVAEPALQLNKTDFGASVLPAGAISYNLVVTNTGTQEATGLTLTDTVPAGTRFHAPLSHPGWSCAPSSLPGSVCTLTFDSLWPNEPTGFGFSLLTDPPPVAAGVELIRNVGRVSDDGTNSGSPKTAIDAENTPLLAAPDLSVSLSDGGATVAAGGTVSYAVSYQQTGDQDATGVVLEATVPSSTRFASGGSTPGWTCTPSSGAAGAACTLGVGDLAAGTTGSAALSLTLDSQLPAGLEQIESTVSIRDDGANGADPTRRTTRRPTPPRSRPPRT